MLVLAPGDPRLNLTEIMIFKLMNMVKEILFLNDVFYYSILKKVLGGIFLKFNKKNNDLYYYSILLISAQLQTRRFSAPRIFQHCCSESGQTRTGDGQTS